MRIGLDIAPISQHRGRGVGALGAQLLETLLRAETEHAFLLFAPEGSPEAARERLRPGRAEVHLRHPAPGNPLIGWPIDAWRLGRCIRRARPDLFHATFQWNLPLRRMPMPVVGHIYDLLPLAAEAIYTEGAAARGGGFARVAMAGLSVRGKMRLYERYLRAALRRVDRAIAISAHTRDDLARLMGFPEERIHVVHPAPALGMKPPRTEEPIDELRERMGLPEGYLLYVGGYDYRKNLEMLLRAYAGARERGLELPLVLAGRMTSPYGRRVALRIRAAREGLPEGGTGVHLLGHIPDGDLPALYAGARLFLYPSLYEGFGLPVLDAMACGAPVLCADATSLPEVAGGAALLLPPGDEEAWAEALLRLADDEAARADMRGRGLARAKAFSWNRAAREVISAYEETAGEEKPRGGS